ncbi:MAG: FkbM family methyltransferase [Chloroflexota bacterium]
MPMPLKRALYRFPALARLIRGGLNAAAPAGLSQITVAAGALQGCRLLLDLHTEKDYWLGVYEPELQAAAGWVRPGWTIYDVGANIGYISLLLACAAGPDGRVFAFEALPDNLERLHANLALNDLQPRVTVIPAAVIDGQRPVRFLVGPSGAMGKAEGSAGRQEVRYAGAIEVDGLSLDEFVYTLGNPAPQLVKMDIEGGEVLALPGMRRLLAQARPLVFLEQHGPESAQAAWQAFTAAGYQVRRMQPGYPAVAALDQLDWKAYLIAVPPGFQPPAAAA